MKVLLIKDIKNIGHAGDIKDFAEGYVRNFLLPQKMATLVTPNAVARHAANLNKKAREKQRQSHEYKKLIKQINLTSLNFSASANESGVLYGAITSAHIKQALQDRGIIINEHQIVLASPLKDVGKYEVKVVLDADHQGFIKVVVTQNHNH